MTNLFRDTNDNIIFIYPVKFKTCSLLEMRDEQLFWDDGVGI
jgi:hypothetical protein